MNNEKFVFILGFDFEEER